MPESAPLHSMESERIEWETVIADLSRTPRLAKLLRHIGEFYFQNRANEISEFQIATQVFGRSNIVFDPSKDSIARVEAYRLRKRLKDYYANEGKDHKVVISLPQGSYIPLFFHRPGSQGATQPNSELRPDANLSRESESEPNVDSSDVGTKTQLGVALPPRLRSLNRKGLWLLPLLGVMILVAGFFIFRHRISNNESTSAGAGVVPITAVNPPQSASDRTPIRILCGYDGAPRIDSSGAYWEADRFYAGGIARNRPDQFITRTSDPMLFEHWRLDEMKYDIPLQQGPYELHLLFVAPQTVEASDDFFDVTANGEPLLPSFNISEDAQGTDVADERVFKDVYPARDGKLHLAFTNKKSTPSISAIELLPSSPHKMLPIRLVTQPSAVKDHLGNIWHPDTYGIGGTISGPPEVVSGTPDPNLYSHERYGHFTYAIPVDTRGRYTLILHFAELYWAADPGVGRRIFSVYCNGTTLLENFDIFKEAGSLNAVTKTFKHLEPSSEGKLNLTFEPKANFATVSAVEVIDESE